MEDIRSQLFDKYNDFWNNNKDSFGDFFNGNPQCAPKIEIGDFDDTVRNGLLFVSCNPSGTDTDFYEQNNKIDYKDHKMMLKIITKNTKTFMRKCLISL